MHIRTACITGACALALALVVPAAARANEVDVAGGLFSSHNGGSAGGAISLGLFNVPITPLSTQLTVAAAGRGGAAGTFDVRLGGVTQVGAGIGVGNFGTTSTTTVIYDAMVAQSIAPHLALEGRMYFGPLRTSTLFAGLRLSL